MKSLVPLLSWISTYSWKRSFPTDLIAGVTVAALLIPESLAYAGIAGVPPEVGLYAAPLALLGYALFGRSGILVVATSSSVAAVSAAVVGDVAADPAEFVVLTAALALIVGVIFVAAGVAKLGWIANFLSTAVLEGFIIGLSLSIMFGQLDELFGLEVEGESALSEVRDLLSNIAEWDGLTVAVGVGSLVLLFGVERFLPRLPGALLVVVLAIVATTVLKLGDEGLAIAGEIPLGLPDVGVPNIDFSDVSALLAGSMAVVLIGFSEGFAAASDMAKKTGDEIDADQELIAYGMSNIGAGLTSGMVVAGSLSKSKANESAGAVSQMSNVVNAVIVVLTLLFLASLFENLPLATLSAVVIHALWRSGDPRKLRPYFNVNRYDFVLGAITLMAVLVLDTLPAVIIGVILSLLVVIYRVSFPHTAELWRDPLTGGFVDRTIHPDAVQVPGVVVYRFDAQLIYSNSASFVREARAMVETATPRPHTLIIDGEVIFEIDATGLERLAELMRGMAENGIDVRLARFHGRALSQIAAFPELGSAVVERSSANSAKAVELAEELSSNTQIPADSDAPEGSAPAQDDPEDL